MSRKFSVSGFDGLDKALARLAGGVPEARMRALLHEGGEIIAAEARRLAPYDTGLLHDSIEVTDDRDARLYGKVNGPGISVYVGPVGSTEDGDVYYAKFQEFGTVSHSARPFMRPAIASKRPEAEALILKRLADDVNGLTK
jgi:HK97 gp10 family phage protein